MPTEPLDANAKEMNLEARGCTYLAPMDFKSLVDIDVISFCSDVFLENIETIKRYARTTTFVNCIS